MGTFSAWELQIDGTLPNNCRISDFDCRMAKTLDIIILSSLPLSKYYARQ